MTISGFLLLGTFLGEWQAQKSHRHLSNLLLSQILRALRTFLFLERPFLAMLWQRDLLASWSPLALGQLSLFVFSIKALGQNRTALFLQEQPFKCLSPFKCLLPTSLLNYRVQFSSVTLCDLMDCSTPNQVLQHQFPWHRLPCISVHCLCP